MENDVSQCGGTTERCPWFDALPPELVPRTRALCELAVARLRDGASAACPAGASVSDLAAWIGSLIADIHVAATRVEGAQNGERSQAMPISTAIAAWCGSAASRRRSSFAESRRPPHSIRGGEPRRHVACRGQARPWPRLRCGPVLPVCVSECAGATDRRSECRAGRGLRSASALGSRAPYLRDADARVDFLSLQDMEGALDEGRTDDVAAALELVTVLMEGSAIAFQFAADFAPAQYRDTVRPTMMPPLAPEGLSGVLSADDRCLQQVLNRLKPRLKQVQLVEADRYRRFVTAFQQAYDDHIHVCSRFVGRKEPSLLMKAGDDKSAVQQLEHFKRLRMKVFEKSSD